MQKLKQLPQAVVAVAIVIIAAIAVIAFALIPTVFGNNPTKTDEGYLLHKDGSLTVTSEYSTIAFEQKVGTAHTGFGVEIAKTAAADLELECIFSGSASLSEQAELLKTHRADVAISSFVKDELGEDDIIYTDPYFSSKLRAVATSDIASTIGLDVEQAISDEEAAATLSGLSVAVAENGHAGVWAADALPQASVVTFASDADCLDAVEAGEADVAILDGGVASYYVCNVYTDLAIAAKIDYAVEYVMALNADNATLRDAINASLEDMHTRGAYRWIYGEYFE